MYYIFVIKFDYIVYKVVQDVRFVELIMYKLQYKGKDKNV